MISNVAMVLQVVQTVMKKVGPIEERLILEPRRNKNKKITQQNGRVYNPLRPERREIRLISLLPAQHHSDEVECSSFLGEWDTASYEALSYTWGDSNLQCSIKVDGQKFAVTKNLRAALKSLRHKSNPRALWIDAICINQADVEERAEQVNQMRFIYESAVGVIVWLGDSPKKIERITSLFDPSTPIDFKETNDSRSSIFFQLLERQWWERMWVIQEVLVAKNVTVQIGKHLVPWARFCQLAQHLERNWPLAWERERISEYTITLMRLRDQHESRISLKYGLLSLAWEFRTRRAGDNRDKLYALLGLLPQDDIIISPDYSKTAEEVYRDFAKAWINRYRSLFIINSTQYQRINGRSWYPRWYERFEPGTVESLNHYEGFSREDFSGMASKSLWEGRFSAAGGHYAPDCSHDNEDILRLRGFEHVR